MKTLCLLSLLSLGVISCGSKTKGLSADDLKYVRTTLAVMRVRSNPAIAADSAQYLNQITAVYKANGMTKERYVQYAATLSKDPQEALAVYNAIQDSVNSKHNF